MVLYQRFSTQSPQNSTRGITWKPAGHADSLTPDLSSRKCSWWDPECGLSTSPPGYSDVHLSVGPLPYNLGFPPGSVVKNPPANAGDVGLIPELGRSPWRSNPLGILAWRIPGIVEPDRLDRVHGGHKELKTVEHACTHQHALQHGIKWHHSPLELRTQRYLQ